jgi:tetratricopeptide (TPR) repeat protein
MHGFMEDSKASISRAADLLDLGMYREAMAVVESLPDDLRSVSAARRIFVRAATGLGRWREALEEAKTLLDGNEADRAEAACAFQSLAAEACNRGREDDAHRLLRAAIRTRLDLLDEILEDQRFPEKFREKLAMKWR